jgi:hypothetical protein
MQMELREKIVAVLRAELPVHTSWEMEYYDAADTILAIPELKEALMRVPVEKHNDWLDTYKTD